MKDVILIALANIGWGFFVWEKIKKYTSKKVLSDNYTDYINKERGIIFRIFPAQFEYEAGFGIPTEKLIDAGVMDKGYSYYIIKL